MTGRPLEVLYVHPNAEIGGADIALVRTIAALDPGRVRASVVLPKPGPLDAALREAGAALHHVPMRMLRTLPSLDHQGRYLAALPRTVAAVAAVIAAVRPALVHTNSLYCVYGAFAARRRRTAHLWHVREIPPRVPVLRAGYARMVNALSDHVLYMTEACEAGLGGARPDGRSSILFDAIDLSRFPFGGHDPSRIRRDLGVPPDAPLVGFAARLDPWKGCPVFIEAMGRVARRVPEAHFLVAGGAPPGFERHEAECRALAEAAGLAGRVHFSGWRYGPGDMADVMAALTVFCHAAVRPEPFGLVLIEAMAVGAPLVAARAGGPVEIVVDGETGLLTPPGDAAALAEAVLALLGDGARRDAMRIAARRRAETTFSAAPFGTALADLYEAVLARSPAASPSAGAPAPRPPP